MTAISLGLPAATIQPIAVDEAYARVASVLAEVEASETLPLDQASDRVLAVDTRSNLPLPMFDNSAVDGYGIHSSDLKGGVRLRVVGRRTAGSSASIAASPGHAVYLATGAAIPDGVAAVVMHEKTVDTGDSIVVREPHTLGANIRRSGEDVAEKSVIVGAGTLLDYRHIGILAAAGVAHVQVRRRIRVALMSTGDEVRPPGERLGPGQIYDVNGPMLSSLLCRGFVDVVAAPRASDDTDAIGTLLRGCSDEADMIITTGGAAGSDSDHALRAIFQAGGTGTALRMALRPGKPIVVGKIGDCAVLSLPGNPLAALVNFLLFARPAILTLAGQPLRRPRGQAALSAEEIEHTGGRTEFAPGRIAGYAEDGRPLITRIGRGGSARLKPLVDADGLIELDPDRPHIASRQRLQFHPFSASFAP